MKPGPKDPVESAFAHDKRKANVMAEENGRRIANAEKTARLRELRLAREAMLREAKAKVKTRRSRT